MTYAKPYLSYAQQLAVLKSRGVSRADDDAALRVLAANGYHNVSGLRLNDGTPSTEGISKTYWGRGDDPR